MITNSANLGYEYAQGWCASFNSDEADTLVASSALLDRRCLYELACHHSYDGPGFDILFFNRLKANDAYLASARLGCGDAMVAYGMDNFSIEDPELYKWFGLALRSRSGTQDREYILGCVERALKKEPKPKLKYQIGKMIKEIPKFSHSQTEYELIVFYDNQTEHARLAVITWILCARRGNFIHKDIIYVIGKYVWNLRWDADYSIDCDIKEKAS